MITPKYENKMVIRELIEDEDGNIIGVEAEKVPVTDEDLKSINEEDEKH